MREFGTRGKNAQNRVCADCTICDDAGGGRPRGGEFPLSMSDFKPGDKNTVDMLDGLTCEGSILPVAD